MGIFRGTPVPPEGEGLYAATSRNYRFFEVQATKYRLAFVGLGLVVLLGGVAVTSGAFAGLPRTYLAAIGAAIVVAEALLQFFQIQSRYVGYRLAAETHRFALEDHNARKATADPNPEAAFEGLLQVRAQEVAAWAKSTLSTRPGSTPASGPSGPESSAG